MSGDEEMFPLSSFNLRNCQTNEKYKESRYIYGHSMMECIMHKEGKIRKKSRYDIVHDIGSAFLFATIKKEIY